MHNPEEPKSWNKTLNLAVDAYKVKEFSHFPGILNGSSYELKTPLIISQRLSLIKEKTAGHLLPRMNELQKMNYGLQGPLSK